MPRPIYHDDNFGVWNIDSDDDVAFYHQVQRESRMKTCKGCGRRVRLRPDYAICNSCAERLENGGDL
jgi:rRNA maturation endonuclease Nob1